jgi:eukaryotic-like serine/threonine-protein kinase
VPRKIGKFEVLEELGRGAMGTVFRARDPVLDRLVALKTVSQELLAERETFARFQREARAAARLQHPGIVTVYELGEFEGSLYIAMELLDGTDLARAMAAGEAMSVKRKLRIMLDVCRALDFAHKGGVVHRDVKPANVRLLADGRVKLVDFGIARVVDSSMTQTGVVLGTPSYMAPEVLKTGRVDHRADIWAAGVVLYELLAGKRPYDAPTVGSLIYKIVHETHAPLDFAALGAPSSLSAIVDKALAKNPDLRYQEMAAMAQELEDVLGLRRSAEVTLGGAARLQEFARHVSDAKRLVSEGRHEAALEAASRARALDPSSREIVGLIDEIEARMRGAAAPPKPPSLFALVKAKGAALFKEAAVFGEPPATSMASIAPDGRHLATAGSDGSIRVWNLESRTRVATLRSEVHRRVGHDALGLALAFTADGSLAASGHVDGAVHLWDLRQAEEVPVKLRHDAAVKALAFSPDGKMLATGGLDSAVKLWDVDGALAGEARREIHRQPAPVTALAYAKGGEWIATGHTNRVVRLVDAASFRLLGTMRGPEGGIGPAVLGPDGLILAVASQDRTIRLFDLAARRMIGTSAAQKKPCVGLTFFSGGAGLASVCLEGSVALWNAATLQPVVSLWGSREEAFAAVVFCRPEARVAVALADGRIRLWEATG